MSWISAIYGFFYEIFFGCSHGNLTRPFTLEAHSYKVCLNCGQHVAYSLEKMRTLRPWEVAALQPAVTALTPIPINARFSESEDFRGTTAAA